MGVQQLQTIVCFDVSAATCQLHLVNFLICHWSMSLLSLTWSDMYVLFQLYVETSTYLSVWPVDGLSKFLRTTPSHPSFSCHSVDNVFSTLLFAVGTEF